MFVKSFGALKHVPALQRAERIAGDQTPKEPHTSGMRNPSYIDTYTHAP